MSRKHENLLRSIFQDPVSGNIQWREVESLLHHLGATTEPLAKARLRVRLNGVEGTLLRPHQGDALGRQDILHIREYLAHAKASPSQYEAIRKESRPIDPDESDHRPHPPRVKHHGQS